MDESEFRIAAERIDIRTADAAPLRRLYEYWAAKRGTRRMPARADIDPAEFPYALGRVNLLDVRATAPRFVFRLRGSEIAALHSRDYTNEPVEAMEPAAYRAMLIEHYEEAAASGKPSCYRIRQVRGRAVGEYVRVILPLSADCEVVNMLLTASHWGPGFPSAAERLGFGPGLHA